MDFPTRELHVERTLSAGRIEAPKTGESRTVDMSAQLTHVLRKAETLKRGWAEVPPWVFCSEAGTPFDLSNAQKALKRTLKKAGLPVTHTLYDLRHTFATLLLADGAPLPTCVISQKVSPRGFSKPFHHPRGAAVVLCLPGHVRAPQAVELTAFGGGAAETEGLRASRSAFDEATHI